MTAEVKELMSTESPRHGSGWYRIIEALWRMAVAVASMLLAIECLRPAGETTLPRGVVVAALFFTNAVYHSVVTTRRFRR
jgi:hypothetical protein